MAHYLHHTWHITLHRRAINYTGIYIVEPHIYIYYQQHYHYNYCSHVIIIIVIIISIIISNYHIVTSHVSYIQY